MANVWRILVYSCTSIFWTTWYIQHLGDAELDAVQVLLRVLSSHRFGYNHHPLCCFFQWCLPDRSFHSVSIAVKSRSVSENAVSKRTLSSIARFSEVPECETQRYNYGNLKAVADPRTRVPGVPRVPKVVDYFVDEEEMEYLVEFIDTASLPADNTHKKIASAVQWLRNVPALPLPKLALWEAP